MSDRIQISATVQRELNKRNLTADEVLREALGVKITGLISGNKFFPEGTVFVAWYKNKALSAIVKDGALECEGQRYSSLSAAAAHYTRRPTTNGWDFWSVRKKGTTEFLPAHKAAETFRAA
jgi:Restriction Enzyme Adenine Methylase Associated